MTVRNILLVLLVSTIGAMQAVAQSEVVHLSLDEALDLAQRQNHQILIAQQEVIQAKGAHKEAWSGFLPQISVSETYLKSTDPVAAFGTKLRQGVFTMQDFDIDALNHPDEIDDFASLVSIQQPLFNLDAIYGKRAANMALNAREQGMIRTQETIVLEVKKAYFGLILAFRHRDAIAQAIQAAEVHYQEVSVAYEKGLVTESDRLAAQVRIGELTEQHVMAEHQIDQASDGLCFLLGLEQYTRIQPTGSLEVTEALPSLDVAGIDTGVSRADLRALAYQHKAAHYQHKMELASWLPRLNAFGTAEWHGTDPFGTAGDHWTLGARLEWNLFDGLGRYGRWEQTAAAAKKVEIQYRQASEKSKIDLRQSWRAMQSAQKRIQVARQAVEHAEEGLRIVEERFREGLEKSSTVLDHEVALTRAQLRLVQAQYDFKIAYSEFEFYQGQPVD